MQNRQLIKQNSILNDREYKSKKLILTSSPKSIFIQVSGPCNSRCIFCSREDKYEYFDLDVYKKRFKTRLFPYILKAEQLFLTGSGEFLQLSDADKILDFFDKTFPYTKKMFATNGFSLTSSICEKLVDSNSEYIIHVSLHASDYNIHKILTKTDTFNQILERLKNLIDLREREKNNKISINLYFVATLLNIEDLPSFIKLAYNLGVDGVFCTYSYLYSFSQQHLSCYFRKKFTNDILSKAEDLAKELNFNVILPPSFGNKVFSGNLPCAEAWTQIMINSEGHVLPCDASEDCNENLLDKSFMDIWNSTYYQNLRKNLINKKADCFKYCWRANPSVVDNFNSHIIRRKGK